MLYRSTILVFVASIGFSCGFAKASRLESNVEIYR